MYDKIHYKLKKKKLEKKKRNINNTTVTISTGKGNTHYSILAWRIPWTEEPGGPQSMGLQRIGQD